MTMDMRIRFISGAHEVATTLGKNTSASMVEETARRTRLVARKRGLSRYSFPAYSIGSERVSIRSRITTARLASSARRYSSRSVASRFISLPFARSTKLTVGSSLFDQSQVSVRKLGNGIS